MTWLAYLLLPRSVLSDMQRDLARIQMSQAQILTKLREINAVLERVAARDEQ